MSTCICGNPDVLLYVGLCTGCSCIKRYCGRYAGKYLACIKHRPVCCYVLKGGEYTVYEGVYHHPHCESTFTKCTFKSERCDGWIPKNKTICDNCIAHNKCKCCSEYAILQQRLCEKCLEIKKCTGCGVEYAGHKSSHGCDNCKSRYLYAACCNSAISRTGWQMLFGRLTYSPCAWHSEGTKSTIYKLWVRIHIFKNTVVTLDTSKEESILAIASQKFQVDLHSHSESDFQQLCDNIMTAIRDYKIAYGVGIMVNLPRDLFMLVRNML
jgi:hypothetical protein